LTESLSKAPPHAAEVVEKGEKSGAGFRHMRYQINEKLLRLVIERQAEANGHQRSKKAHQKVVDSEW